MRLLLVFNVIYLLLITNYPASMFFLFPGEFIASQILEKKELDL